MAARQFTSEGRNPFPIWPPTPYNAHLASGTSQSSSYFGAGGNNHPQESVPLPTQSGPYSRSHGHDSERSFTIQNEDGGVRRLSHGMSPIHEDLQGLETPGQRRKPGARSKRKCARCRRTKRGRCILNDPNDPNGPCRPCVEARLQDQCERTLPSETERHKLRREQECFNRFKTLFDLGLETDREKYEGYVRKKLDEPRVGTSNFDLQSLTLPPTSFTETTQQSDLPHIFEDLIPGFDYNFENMGQFGAFPNANEVFVSNTTNRESRLPEGLEYFTYSSTDIPIGTNPTQSEVPFAPSDVFRGYGMSWAPEVSLDDEYTNSGSQEWGGT